MTTMDPQSTRRKHHDGTRSSSRTSSSNTQVVVKRRRARSSSLVGRFIQIVSIMMIIGLIRNGIDVVTASQSLQTTTTSVNDDTNPHPQNPILQSQLQQSSYSSRKLIEYFQLLATPFRSTGQRELEVLTKKDSSTLLTYLLNVNRTMSPIVPPLQPRPPSIPAPVPVMMPVQPSPVVIPTLPNEETPPTFFNGTGVVCPIDKNRTIKTPLQFRDGKKGIGMELGKPLLNEPAIFVNFDKVLALNVSWYYTWQVHRRTRLGSIPSFVPMTWGATPTNETFYDKIYNIRILRTV